MPIKQRQKMRAVARAITPCAVILHQRHKGCGRGHGQNRKGPCMQFVDKGVAQRVIGHGGGFLNYLPYT
jgi:hypothetical protein